MTQYCHRYQGCRGGCILLVQEVNRLVITQLFNIVKFRSVGQLIPAEPQDGPNDPYAGFNLGEGPGDDWGQDDGDDNDFSLLGDNDPQTGPVGVNQNILTGAVCNENKGTKIGSRIEHAGNLKEKKFQV